jgi:hypothetical protein
LSQIGATRPSDLDRRGQQQVYAIYKKGSKRPLYVGHVHGRKQSVLRRLLAHMSGATAGSATSATGKLSKELKKHLKDAYVQVGTYDTPLNAQRAT